MSNTLLSNHTIIYIYDDNHIYASDKEESTTLCNYQHMN